MGRWHSMRGLLEIELTCAEPERFLAELNAIGIEILHVQCESELTYVFWIKKRDLGYLKSLCEKRGGYIRVCARTGMIWQAKQWSKRYLMVMGLIAAFAFATYLPSRVFFVKVEGNHDVPARKILEAAEQCGIQFGASRREVRSEKIKNALLSRIPELQWAGVNTAGCVAVISVREKAEQDQENEKHLVSNIIAERDGYILSGTVIKGSAVFQPGQTVTAGQILISGYTDCGISIRTSRAQGEIIAQTMREVNAVTPKEYLRKGTVQKQRQKISLLIRKKRINLWKDSGISDGSCGRMYKEYYITLPGRFQLPIALCIETYTECDIQYGNLMEPQSYDSLKSFAHQYLLEHMIAGEILDGIEQFLTDKNVYKLRGTYICREMIGREQQVQIGETNGKRD